jgi:hypothetical protein
MKHHFASKTFIWEEWIVDISYPSDKINLDGEHKVLKNFRRQDWRQELEAAGETPPRGLL